MNYAELMDKCDRCVMMATRCLKRGDSWLAEFWVKASQGYRKRALNMVFD